MCVPHGVAPRSLWWGGGHPRPWREQVPAGFDGCMPGRVSGKGCNFMRTPGTKVPGVLVTIKILSVLTVCSVCFTPIYDACALYYVGD